MNKFVVLAMELLVGRLTLVSRLANGHGKGSYHKVVELWAPCVHKGTYGSPYVMLVIYGQN